MKIANIENEKKEDLSIILNFVLLYSAQNEPIASNDFIDEIITNIDWAIIVITKLEINNGL